MSNGNKLITLSNLSNFLSEIDTRFPTGNGTKRLLWSSLNGVECSAGVSIQAGSILGKMLRNRFLIIEYGFEDDYGNIMRFRTDPIYLTSPNDVRSESFSVQLNGISGELTATISVRMNPIYTNLIITANAISEDNGASAYGSYVYAIYEDTDVPLYSDKYNGETAEVNEFYYGEVEE